MDGIDVGYLVKFLLSLLLKVIVSEFAAQSAMQKLALGLTGAYCGEGDSLRS